MCPPLVSSSRLFFSTAYWPPLVLCVMRVRELVHTRSYDRTGGQKEWDVDDPKFTHDLKRERERGVTVCVRDERWGER